LSFQKSTVLFVSKTVHAEFANHRRAYEIEITAHAALELNFQGEFSFSASMTPIP